MSAEVRYTILVIAPITSLFQLGYSRIAKPLLFRIPPDTVHHWLMRIGRIGGIPLAANILRATFRYDDPMLKQTIHGISFENPVGLAAGFDKNAEVVPLMHAVGLGFTTVGSMTAETCEGNPRPWFHRLPNHHALLVHAGLANDGVETINRSLLKLSMPSGFPVIASVAKTNSRETCDDDTAIADYKKSYDLLQGNTSIQIIEINISCPNTYGGEPFTSPERLSALLSSLTIASADSKPVWLKMPIDLKWDAMSQLIKIAIHNHIAGINIGNLRKDRTGLDVPDGLPGGISGSPTFKTSTELIGKAYRKYGDQIIIIGTGGIKDARDAYEKIKQGASLVELITGLVYRGPSLIGQINQDMVHLLKADGFSHISEAVGSAHRHTTKRY